MDLSQAIEILKNDGVVGMPTETVYGLAARIDKPIGIEKIFKTKERPFFDPLIVHISSTQQAKDLTKNWCIAAEVLAKKFWPGPLTMILPKSDLVNSMITSGLPSVGIRMPEHPTALELITQAGVPLAAPSANKFGRTSPTTADHVRSEFKNDNVLVLDGGACKVGIESTVLHIQEQNGQHKLSILRKGAITQSEIAKVLSAENIDFNFVETVDKKESPGHMKHHYMPAIPFFILKPNTPSTQLLELANQNLSKIPDEVDSVKIVKPLKALHNPVELKLSSDPALAAREFYSQLRQCAASGADCIYFRLTDDLKNEKWEGLLDRMNKAASLVL